MAVPSAPVKQKTFPMVTIYGFIPDGVRISGPGTPTDISPFVQKLETALRFMGLPYKKEGTAPNKAPKGKLPYAVLNGSIVSDTSFILDHLKDVYGLDIDGGLSEKDAAILRGVQILLENSIYWVGVYDRFVVDENWAITKSYLQKTLPFVLRPIVPGFIRSGLSGQCEAMGYGVHNTQQIEENIALKDLQALSTQLGDKKYLIDDKPRSVDAMAFASLWIYTSSKHKGYFKENILKFKNLMSYVERIRQEFFPGFSDGKDKKEAFAEATALQSSSENIEIPKPPENYNIIVKNSQGKTKQINVTPSQTFAQVLEGLGKDTKSWGLFQGEVQFLYNQLVVEAVSSGDELLLREVDADF